MIYTWELVIEWLYLLFFIWAGFELFIYLRLWYSYYRRRHDINAPWRRE